MINTKLKFSNFETRKNSDWWREKESEGSSLAHDQKKQQNITRLSKHKSATHRMKRKTVGGCIKKMRVIVIDVKPLARTGRVQSQLLGGSHKIFFS